MQFHHTSLSALFPILLTSVATAQELPVQVVDDRAPATASSSGPAGPALPIGKSISVMRASYGVRRLDGAVHAEGADYWAVFDRGGIRYTPALGRAAAKDMPLRLTLVSIRRGDTAIHRADPAAADGAVTNPRVRIDGVGRAVYDRGSITERYEARPDGIEQSFRFVDRPAGRGDLVVRFRVDTALPAAGEGRVRESLRFVAQNIGGVRIGAVTGIAADGRRARGSMRYDGQHLELVLPDAFVSSAAYPMVLDPLIGTDRVVGGAGNQDIFADVAYDASRDRYLVVWQRVFSVGNTVVRGRLVDGSTGALLTPSFIEITAQGGVEETRPAVASLNSQNGFVIVWHQTPTSSGGSNGGIYGRFMSAGAILGPLGPVSTAPNFNSGRLDVGGDSTTGSNVAVVFRPPTGGIRYVRVSYSSTGRVGIPNISHLLTGSRNSFNPAISKSAGPGGVFCVVWESNGTGIGNRFVGADGQLLSSASSLVRMSGLGRDLRQPQAPDVDVDSDFSGRASARIALHERQSTGTALQVVTARLIAPRDPTTAPSVLVSSQVVVSDPGTFSDNPTVAFMGRRPSAVQVRAIGWVARPVGDSARIRVQKFDTSTRLCGTPSETTRSGESHFVPSSAAQFSGGSSRDGALMVWHTRRDSDGGNDVRAQLYASAAGGRVRDAAPGCAGGGQLSIAGPFAHGQSVDVTLTGASTSANLCLFAVGFQGARSRFPCGACSFLLAPSQSFVAIQNGQAAVRGLQVPCDPQFHGVEVDFQFWVGQVSNSGCGLIPVATSNIVRATIDN